MSELEHPVIPCIQDLPNNECNIADCLYNQYTGLVTALHREKIRQIKDGYHTCVVIQRDSNLIVTEKTLWISQNTDRLETLLIGFFTHYANRKTISDISIVCTGVTVMN